MTHSAPPVDRAFKARAARRVKAFHRRLDVSREYLEAHGYVIVAPDPLPTTEIQPISPLR